MSLCLCFSIDRLFLVQGFQQLYKAIYALGNAFHHQVSLWFYCITDEVQPLQVSFRLYIFTLCDSIDGPLAAICPHS